MRFSGPEIKVYRKSREIRAVAHPPACVILVGLIVATLAACASPNGLSESPSDFVHIATCALDEITTTHITALLESHGIPCQIYGSAAYTVRVPEKEVARARTILMEESARRSLSVWFDTPAEGYTPAEQAWHSQVLNIRVDKLLSEPGYGSDSDIGAVLRHDEVVQASKKFPIVVSIESCALEYLDVDRQYKTGHIFKLVLGSKADTESFEFVYQARDGGKHVTFFGGNGQSYTER